MSSIANWVAAALTLALLSVIFKQNEAYYWAEHLFVGSSAGYFVAQTFGNYIKPTIQVDILQNGKWYFVIPALLGILMYTRLSPKYQWLSRYPVAFTMGVGAGVVLTKTWKPMLLDQVAATIMPLAEGAKTSTAINAALLLIGVFTTLSFFLFTVEPKGLAGVSSRIGRYTMMLAFGAAFGTTVMARVSLFLGRMQFLLIDFLEVAK
ncbi:MAG: hypothetical protein ACOX3V_02785 [Bacillota bacterium]|jgi:hypothetical protein